MLLAFMPLPMSEPTATWIGLVFLAVCEARQRIHGRFSVIGNFVILVVLVGLLALD
jgi:hypothetical protein